MSLFFTKSFLCFVVNRTKEELKKLLSDLKYKKKTSLYFQHSYNNARQLVLKMHFKSYFMAPCSLFFDLWEDVCSGHDHKRGLNFEGCTIYVDAKFLIIVSSDSTYIYDVRISFKIKSLYVVKKMINSKNSPLLKIIYSCGFRIVHNLWIFSRVELTIKSLSNMKMAIVTSFLANHNTLHHNYRSSRGQF
jgi:hypothetical protein